MPPSSSTHPPSANTTSSPPPSHLPPPPTSPPPTVSSPSVARTHAHAPTASTLSTSSSRPPPQTSHISPTLPSSETQRHVAQARAAVVATLENTMDSELQWRAAAIHDNAAVLSRQVKDVQRATDALRRENDKLAREADVAARKLKELGNVQNWAEVLEREFLVIEETIRLANGGGSSCSCSCSDCGDGSGSEDEMDVDGGDRRDGKGVVREGGEGAWSDASRSLTERESSTGRGAKGSDTASVSTMSR